MPKKVLVVDNDKNILDAITFLLEDCGYTVESLSNGKKVVEAVNRFSPDILLLDILLSGTDGKEICKVIKSKTSSKVHIIIFSSYLEHMQPSLYGADAYISKPFAGEDILQAIESI